ncbi:MAG: hypothetical protein GY791_08115 [Alphaproteobacteria bacterium]|nr:hypothetical protein [Alphaproteobacteria bacterium]
MLSKIITPRSPLGRLQPTRIDYDDIKRRAWRDSGILVVDVETVAGVSWPDRQHLRNIGDKLYGPRTKDGDDGDDSNTESGP